MSRSSIVAVLAGVTLVALVVFLWRGLGAPRPAMVAPVVTAPPAPPDVPVPPPAELKPPAPPSGEKIWTQEEKGRAAAEGEQARAAAAAAKLGAIDFDQPRPPPPAAHSYVPKVDRQMGADEKAVQAENVLSAVRSRIDLTERRVRETRARGGDASFDEVLVERLRRRATELTERADQLHQSAGRGEPPPEPIPPKPRVLGEQ